MANLSDSADELDKLSNNDYEPTNLAFISSQADGPHGQANRPKKSPPAMEKREKNENGSLQSQQWLRPASLTHEVSIIILLCLTGQIVVQAGLAQAIIILHIIGDHFNSSPAEQSWYAAAYSLTVGTFILFAGRCGDIYGHKRVLIFGLLWFALWNLLAGVAAYSGQILFDICRAFEGSGAAFLTPNAVAIIGRMYPPGKRKGMVMSLFGACAPNGYIFGAVISSIFGQFAWWPWTFWTCTMVTVACAVGAYFIIPTLPQDTTDLRLIRTPTKSPLAQRLEQLDVLGAATGVAGLVLINFAWNQGPVVGWQVPYTYVLLIVGFLSLAVFFFVELHLATNPLVPVKKIGFDSAYALACIAGGWSSFGIWNFYLQQLFEVLRHQAPILAAAENIPSGISGAAAALTTAFLITRVPPGFIMLAAMVGFGVGNALLVNVPVDQTYWAQTFVCSIVTPWGMDLSFPSAIMILSDAMPREEQGTAASLVTTVQNYSIAIGLGIAGTIDGHVNRGGKDILRGYRGAWYAAVGLDVLGVAVASTYILHTVARKRRTANHGKEGIDVETRNE